MGDGYPARPYLHISINMVVVDSRSCGTGGLNLVHNQSPSIGTVDTAFARIGENFESIHYITWFGGGQTCE
jgi:coproporphyrinogen III oxidase